MGFILFSDQSYFGFWSTWKQEIRQIYNFCFIRLLSWKGKWPNSALTNFCAPVRIVSGKGGEWYEKDNNPVRGYLPFTIQSLTRRVKTEWKKFSVPEGRERFLFAAERGFLYEYRYSFHFWFFRRPFSRRLSGIFCWTGAPYLWLGWALSRNERG